VLAECEEGVCGTRFGAGEEGDGGDAWEFADEASHLWRVLLLVARDGHEHSGDVVRAKVDEQFVERFAVQGVVASLAGGIDALAFGGGEEGGDGAIAG
jgi:hypothetical protein